MKHEEIVAALLRMSETASLDPKLRHEAIRLRVDIEVKKGLIYTRARGGELTYHNDRACQLERLHAKAIKFLNTHQMGAA